MRKGYKQAKTKKAHTQQPKPKRKTVQSKPKTHKHQFPKSKPIRNPQTKSKTSAPRFSLFTPTSAIPTPPQVTPEPPKTVPNVNLTEKVNTINGFLGLFGFATIGITYITYGPFAFAAMVALLVLVWGFLGNPLVRQVEKFLGWKYAKPVSNLVSITILAAFLVHGYLVGKPVANALRLGNVEVIARENKQFVRGIWFQGLYLGEAKKNFDIRFKIKTSSEINVGFTKLSQKQKTDLVNTGLTDPVSDTYFFTIKPISDLSTDEPTPSVRYRRYVNDQNPDKDLQRHKIKNPNAIYHYIHLVGKNGTVSLTYNQQRFPSFKIPLDHRDLYLSTHAIPGQKTDSPYLGTYYTNQGEIELISGPGKDVIPLKTNSL
jgi:hypothetical protein